MTTDLMILLILGLPLAGALFNGVLGLFAPALRREPIAGVVGTLTVTASFLLTVLAFVGYGGEPVVAQIAGWMQAGDLDLHFAYRIDELSLVMTLVITGVGALIHLYSMGYMHGDGGYWRFFAYLNLFIFAMLNLVLGDNLVVLFLGWEGVGLCSYLLIGFWYKQLKNSEAANKAFIVNRIGDFAFLVAMFMLFRELGSLDFDVVLSGAPDLPEATRNWIVGLLFIGATGKSAQIPLFVWLPDAMAGPTPVSALIHAATMVTSGLYLLARLSPLVLSAPAMMTVIGLVAALTALMAAVIAMTQNDIKKVLAYSTVSQLGFMFMAAGVGAFFVAIFHVVTHAFFKACLFLGSGSVIHAMHHVEHELAHEGLIPAHADEPDALGLADGKPPHAHPAAEPFDPQDMRTMGGLARFMPATNITFFLSTLAIAGIPPLAGFISKDEILFRAFEYGYDGHAYAWFVWGVGLFTAFLTAFYMTRCYVLTFLGKPRWPAADRVHPHESPATMTIPLYVLATLAVFGGLLGIPAVIHHGEWNWIHHWLGAPYGGPVAEPALAEHGEGFLLIELGLLLLGAVIAVAGVLAAYYRYVRLGLEADARLRQALGGLYRLGVNKFYWDEAYDRAIVKPILNTAAKGLFPFDQHFVDGAVNGAGRLARALGGRMRLAQSGVVQHYALALVLGVIAVLGLMLYAG